MKKITLCAAAFALSASLLASCSSTSEEAPAGEETTSVDNLIYDDIVVDEALQAELEAMRDRNFLENVFDTYVVAGYAAESWSYENGEKALDYTFRESFTSAGSGIVYQTETDYGDGDLTGFATYVNEDGGPYALCFTAPNYDYAALEVYPEGKYAEMVLKRWVIVDDGPKERVVSITTDEDACCKVFVTRVVYEDDYAEAENTYFVDVETGFVTKVQQVLYDLETGELSRETIVDASYNEPFEFTTTPVADVLDGENLCETTIVFNPGQDDEEVQTFFVLEGTVVYACVDNQYPAMYSDVECTEEIEGIVASGDEATAYVNLVD